MYVCCFMVVVLCLYSFSCFSFRSRWDFYGWTEARRGSVLLPSLFRSFLPSFTRLFILLTDQSVATIRIQYIYLLYYHALLHLISFRCLQTKHAINHYHPIQFFHHFNHFNLHHNYHHYSIHHHLLSFYLSSYSSFITA